MKGGAGAVAAPAPLARPLRFKFNCNPGGLTISQISKFYSKVYDIPVACARTQHTGVASGFVVKRGYRLLLNVGEWTFRVVKIDQNGIVLEGHKRRQRLKPKLKRWFRSKSVMEWLCSNHIPRRRFRAITGIRPESALGPRGLGARYLNVGPRIDTGLIGGRLPPAYAGTLGSLHPLAHAPPRTHSAPAGALLWGCGSPPTPAARLGSASRRWYAPAPPHNTNSQRSVPLTH